MQDGNEVGTGNRQDMVPFSEFQTFEHLASAS